jgi:hypothetical protein
VSWQTIFWTLVPLAIGSMSQPGGRICGLSSRYRTYLRCSPILCSADALSVVLQLIASYTYQRQSVLEAIGTLLHERFNPDEGLGGQEPGDDILAPEREREFEGEAEGILSLEKMTWLRWLWFILGTLPPTIKLMAMKGIPWEQAWGMMFLASWVINEGLIIFATSNQSFFTISRTGRISWPGFEQTTKPSGYRKFQLMVKIMRRVLAATALTVHVVILNGVFRAIFRHWKTFDNYQVTIDSRLSPLAYRSTVSFDIVIIISLGVLVFLALVFFLLQAFSFSIINNVFFIVPVVTFSIMLASYSVNISLIHLASPRMNIYLSAQYIFGISTVPLLCILALLQFLGRRFVMLGNNLLVTYPDGLDSKPRIDQGACLSLVFFLTTVLGCGLWYGCIYDSSGTFNPTWTSVFG